jgi:homopolymeric O-antigen transport system ATP-binding protein
MSVVLRVENLWKQYRLGVLSRGALYRDVQSWMARLRGKEDPNSPVAMGQKRAGTAGDLVWALRDISFEVKEGEILGIIGRNGAGKSTLLKIISRVTGPTRGNVKVKGRIASLLEVGTGFHPELTGRENIFLNGAILGMTRAEIRKKFDEIVDFSGVEQYIDTPVKRYSSGMYVRLAFAVAAHLEPEILLVDEVLAVGDAEFQKKCIGKMKEVSKGGRTVLFISHNMGMISALCGRALLLHEGEKLLLGEVGETVSRYYNNGKVSPFHVDYSQGDCPVGDHLATLLKAWTEDCRGSVCGDIDIRQSFSVKMVYRLHASTPVAPFPNFHFYNSQGTCVFVSLGGRNRLEEREPGIYEACCLVPASLLNNDTYFVDVALTFTHCGIHVSFWDKSTLAVTIVDPIAETVDSTRRGYSGPIPGTVRPELKWEVRRVS